jgi:hypothetical protein
MAVLGGYPIQRELIFGQVKNPDIAVGIAGKAGFPPAISSRTVVIDKLIAVGSYFAGVFAVPMAACQGNRSTALYRLLVNVII